MNVGEKYNVIIEKLTNLGLGLTRVDGKVVFVENACPQDELEIEITKTNKNYSNGKIIEILKPSENRTKPFCPMQKICGACQIQYINYDYQLEIKRQIVEETLNQIANINIEVPKTIPSPQIKCYRHKVQYPVVQTKNSKRLLAGYYKQASHELINIKYCPIQPEICDDIIDFIRNEGAKLNISGYNEKLNKGILRHIIIRSSEYNKKCLVCLVINSHSTPECISKLCEKIHKQFENITGVCVNFNSAKTNVILGDKTICLYGNDYVEEKICNKIFHIASDTFFQINPLSAQNIFNYIKEFIKKNYNKPIILDAYAGISAIGICLSDLAKKVVSIEENKKSVELALNTIKLNNITNIEINGGDAEEFFNNENRKYDIVILDPPRKGCSKKSLIYAHKLCKGHIIYVSCNPATLARDLKILKEMGAEIQSVQPFDMFCHTYHIENAAIIKV